MSASARRAHASGPRGDVLRWPVLGAFLRWRWGRLALQSVFVGLAALLVIDGFVGPQLASRNLATVGAWVHYRGFLVLALLLAGNLFCMACPFTLPRTLGRRLALRGRRFPRVLRNKWASVGVLFALFFAYEWLDLWASPWLTAWLIVAYFVASFVLEAAFTESAFCKYVCPLGAFNFVYSTASPTRIGVRNADVCRTCVGKECVNGAYSAKPIVLLDAIGGDGAPTHTHSHTPRGALGCGTELFPPQMTSNMDCTLCLDCVRACPHDNVGLFVRTPGAELAQPGAWPARWDLAFLVVALAFMGVSNAFGMVPPVYAMLDALTGALAFIPVGLGREGVALLLVFGVLNLALPAGALVGGAWASRRLGRLNGQTLRQVAAAFAPVFVPVGLGVWTAHYLFHFLTGATSIVPVAQEFFGLTPTYGLPAIMPDSALLGCVEVAFLLGGYALGMLLAQRTALRLAGRRSLGAFLPWALVLSGLLLASWWIMQLPMEMRGLG